MTPEQEKVLARACAMVKRSCSEFKRVVLHLAPDGQEDTVDYEVHGKVKVKENK